MLKTLINKKASYIEDRQLIIDRAWAGVGVTEQFLDNAETYHERYFKTPYWEYHVGQALRKARVDLNASLKVLDVGSGSGNTVLPALHLMPNCQIVATDISPNLLRILGSLAKQQNLPAERLGLVCFDLERDFFEPSSFDLVIGGAILHHIIHPELALGNIARWLKPGGAAILFEPFEYGTHLLCALFQSLIDETRKRPADPRLVRFLKSMNNDAEHRFGVGRSKPWTSELDDKWLFNIEYIDGICRAQGCRSVEVEPMNIGPTYFLNSVRAYLSVSGNGDVPVPQWAEDIIAEFDTGISMAVKQRLFAEGAIIIHK
jgi:SAM-dependent methyltransferase